MNKPGPVDYKISVTPAAYVCGQCGASGVKLWRKYQTFLEHQTVMCAACSCRDQGGRGKDYSVSQLPSGHVVVTTTYDPVKEPKLFKIYGGQDRGGDQIGWRIPAVPTEDGDTYWGYSSVPAEGVAWWDALPLVAGDA